MGVGAEEQRTGDAATGAEVDDGLADGGDMSVVEGGVCTRASVPRGPERHRLRRGARAGPGRIVAAEVGREHVVGRDEPRDVDERRAWGALPGERVSAHGSLLLTRVNVTTCP